ncbi:MAG: FAD-dependent oxidoreductase [Wenzhouxiangellaceae bacterium]|nr:FAD-dependent oxidoreductase [Wenzhouxiangellaceae bacterium]
MSEAFDALIIGAGTVGASAALALARSGREVALIDRKRPAERPAEAALDPRVVAVSPGSKKLLETLGAWQRMRHERVAAYTEMRVLAGRGEVCFRAAEHGLGALGWIAELGELDHALGLELAERRRISIFAPAEIEAIETGSDRVAVKLADGAILTCHMLIGADGAKSRVRKAAGIDVSAYHYNQHAIVAHLETEAPNPGIAWQRFTDLGPLALLPLPGGRSSLVWSVHDQDAQTLMGLDDDQFLEALAEHCKNSPFGTFSHVDQRHALALVRRQSRPLAAGRVALLGDAARSVHPLAGQGLNLGLADVAALIEALDGWQAGGDPSRRLARYGRRRWSDSTLVAGGIHVINESQTLGGPGRLALGAGFTAMRLARPARELFVRRACGLDEVKKAVELLAE